MNEHQKETGNGDVAETSSKPIATTSVSNGQIIVFQRASEESVREAINYRMARGNQLKQLALGLESGAGYILPETLVNSKGQPRTLQSLRISAKRWGADVGKDHNGQAIIFKQ